MIYGFSYLLVGCAMYLAVVHFTLQSDRELPEGIRWVILGWPVIYLIGILELIDWIAKEIRDG